MSNEKAGLLFFIIGGLTSFFDLLTAPLVTLGLPAIVLLLLRKKINRSGHFKDYVFILLCISLSWLVGYAIIWVSKWLLASIFLHENILQDGFREVIQRTGSQISSGSDVKNIQVNEVLMRNAGIIFSNFGFLLIGLTMCIFIDF